MHWKGGQIVDAVVVNSQVDRLLVVLYLNIVTLREVVKHVFLNACYIPCLSGNRMYCFNFGVKSQNLRPRKIKIKRFTNIAAASLPVVFQVRELGLQYIAFSLFHRHPPPDPILRFLPTSMPQPRFVVRFQTLQKFPESYFSTPRPGLVALGQV